MREPGKSGQWGRAVPLVGIVEVGEVDLHVLIDELVAEGDPERFEPGAGLVEGADPVGADDEEDVGDGRGPVGAGSALDPDELAGDRGDDRAGPGAEQAGEVEQEKVGPFGWSVAVPLRHSITIGRRQVPFGARLGKTA